MPYVSPIVAVDGYKCLDGGCSCHIPYRWAIEQGYWVAGTYGKGKCKAVIDAGEKLICVISIGYGLTKGASHRSKEWSKLCKVSEKDMPEWFKEGIEAALMAPTAMNQQKFLIDLDGDKAVIKAGIGPFTKLDCGIVRYNFEAASDHKCRSI